MRHEFVGVRYCLGAVRIDQDLEIPVHPCLAIGGTLLDLMLSLHTDFLPRRDHVHSQVNIRQFYRAVGQHCLKAIGIAGLGEQPFGFLEVGLVVLREARQFLQFLWRQGPWGPWGKQASHHVQVGDGTECARHIIAVQGQ